MALWIVITAIGGVLSLSGLAVLLRQYHRGEITWRYVLAVVVGYISFVTYAVLSAVQSQALSGVLTVLVLLPAFLAIIVVVYERQRAGDGGRSRR